MHGFYFPGGFNFLGAIVVDVLAGLVFLIWLAVVVALVVVLVRFLLVATKAAQIYVDKNSGRERVVVPPAETPPAAAAPPEPAPSTPVATSFAADTAPTLPVVTKGPTKPRGPKKN